MALRFATVESAHSKEIVDVQAFLDGHMKSAEPQKGAIG